MNATTEAFDAMNAQDCDSLISDLRDRVEYLERVVREAWLVSENAREWNRSTTIRMREVLEPAADTLHW